MGIEERLRRLRGPLATAAIPVAAPPSPPHLAAPTLAERLRRVNAGGHRGGAMVDEVGLADALGAERLEPGVLCLERRISARLGHGRGVLGRSHAARYLPLPAGRPEAHAAPRPWLCLDTETSGLAGGTGTWAFLAGLLREEGECWRLRQYLLTRLDAEPAFLARVAAELAVPGRLLSYNGRAFDVPLLATRFRLAGRPDPLAGLPHLDLLAPMRRAFGNVWADCRLATAESRLLGVRRRDDLPGAAAPQAWLDWLRRGEVAPLAGVLRHNRLDLLSLAALLPVLDSVYRDPEVHGADPRGVAAAHLAGGDPGLALRILAASRYRLDRCGLLELARLYRRDGRWEEAVGIWGPLSAAGDLEARAALARYHEHRTKDIDLALSLAQSLPPGPGRERRLGRLLRKLEAAGRGYGLGGQG